MTNRLEQPFFGDHATSVQGEDFKDGVFCGCQTYAGRLAPDESAGRILSGIVSPTKSISILRPSREVSVTKAVAFAWRLRSNSWTTRQWITTERIEPTTSSMRSVPEFERDNEHQKQRFLQFGQRVCELGFNARRKDYLYEASTSAVG